MLPDMEGCDKRRHGVDLLNRDFVVLGKLVYMLGVCMECMAMHPKASAIAPALLDMIRYREVSQHAEAYVRRSVLFAASSVLIALHMSYVASVLIEGNQDISTGLEWIRTWALRIAEADPDTECTLPLQGPSDCGGGKDPHFAWGRRRRRRTWGPNDKILKLNEVNLFSRYFQGFMQTTELKNKKRCPRKKLHHSLFREGVPT